MDTRALVAAYNSLGQRLYERFAAQHDGNTVLSPVSIGTVLAMALSGARGATEQEMRAVLGHAIDRATMEAASGALLADLGGYDGCSTNPIVIANALLLDHELGARIRPEFAALAKESYAAEVLADVSVEAVNAWAYAKTMGRVPRLLEQSSKNAVAVLLNAMVFAANWASPFRDNITEAEIFRAPVGDVPVVMMHQAAIFDCLFVRDFRAVRLPFTQPWLSLTIVLPDGPLSTLDRSLDEIEFRVLMQALRSKPLALTLPRFRIQTELDLASLLQDAGMRLAFSDAADFSGMAEPKHDFAAIDGKPSNKIGQVRHGASIEVGEQGVVAAAVTVVEFAAAGSRAVEYIPFVVDRPFLFFLLDHLTGAILMRGRVLDPNG